MRPCIWTAVGALGLWFGFPNTIAHMPPLALLYPAALYALGLCAQSRIEALRLGWLCGLIGASTVLIWLAVPIQDVGGLPFVLALPCAVCIGACVALFGGIFSVCAHVLRQHWAQIPALGLIWYVLELLRGTVLTGFPWLTQAAAFAPWPIMLQGASIIGAYGLGGLFAACACLLVQPWTQPQTQPQTQPWALQHTMRSYRSLLTAVLLLMLCAAFGAWRLHASPPDTFAHGLHEDAFGVIMVEGNMDQGQKWNAALQTDTVELYLRLSRTALDAYTASYPNKPAPLILWPETAMPFYVQTHKNLTPLLYDFTRTHNIWLLLGAPGFTRKQDAVSTHNRAFLLGPHGAISAWYDKEHLVPFGEFLPPMLDFAFLAPLLQGVGAFTPGTQTAPLRTDTLALGVLICYEAIFPEIAQARVADGANVLINISNDGWFGHTAAPRQHLELTVLRAVEQNRWIVRATNTGISAIIDGFGRITLMGTQHSAQALTGFARPSASHSVYFVIGPWLPLAALMLLLLLLCIPQPLTPSQSCST